MSNLETTNSETNDSFSNDNSLNHSNATNDEAHNQSWLDEVTYTAEGLVPAIAQDHATGEILMMAWMNREALQLTAQSKTAVYYSRSRGKLWHKGETSGHTQIVHDIHLDCDADVIVLSVTQIGGIACHTGRKSCFYRQLNLSADTPSWDTVTPVIKDPNEIYGTASSLSTDAIIEAEHNAQKNEQTSSLQASSDTKNSTDIEASSVLQHLDEVMAERKQADPKSSYVASLYAKGLNKILEKVGEEAVESIIAAKDLGFASNATNTLVGVDNAIAPEHQALVDDFIYEVADVWFHTIVTLSWFNIGSDRILAELARRFGLSGIDEKNSRTQ